MGQVRNGALYASGSELLDLSVTDAVFDPATQDVPIGIRVDAATTLKVTGYDGRTDTHVLAAGEVLTMMIGRVWRTGTSPTTGIHAMY